MRKPLYLGFVNPAGGVGHSTLAAVICSMLCYDCGVRLLALDCDGAQGSFSDLRADDQASLSRDKAFRRRLAAWHDRLMVAPYPVERASVPHALQVAEDYVARGCRRVPDLVVFDFPWYLSDPRVLDLVSRMDYLLFPLDLSQLGWERTQRALHTLETCLAQRSMPLGRVLAVWSENGLHRPDFESWLASTSADLAARGYTLMPSLVDLGPNIHIGLRSKGFFGPFVRTLMSLAYGGEAGLGLDDLLRAMIAQLHLPVRIGHEMLKELW